MAFANFPCGRGEQNGPPPVESQGIDSIVEVFPGSGWLVVLSELAGAYDFNVQPVLQLIGSDDRATGVGGRMLTIDTTPGSREVLIVQQPTGPDPRPFEPGAGRLAFSLWRKGPSA